MSRQSALEDGKLTLQRTRAPACPYDLDQRGPPAKEHTCSLDLEKAPAIRRKIALFRQYLADGAVGELAQSYLREIVKLEADLQLIEKGKT
jgi:hypothetical protein